MKKILRKESEILRKESGDIAKGKREEPFSITQKEKNELGILAINLRTVDRGFNLHTFLLRRKKMIGRFPPADKVIKIGRQVLKNKKQFKGHNLWAYFTTAVSKEEAMSFAEKNIKENENFKGMKPIACLLNPALLGG